MSQNVNILGNGVITELLVEISLKQSRSLIQYEQCVFVKRGNLDSDTQRECHAGSRVVYLGAEGLVKTRRSQNSTIIQSYVMLARKKWSTGFLVSDY